MKKGVAIFFLFSFLLAATELHQLVKLPHFISHFVEHNQERPTSVFAFIIIHYASGDVHDADYERDMQLPFKSVKDCEFTSVVFHSGISSVSLELPTPVFIPKIYRLYTASFISSDLAANIWQPPKA